MADVTPQRLEQLMKSMEVLLSEVEQLRCHCGPRATELMQLALELRQEQRELAEKYAALAHDMDEVMDTVDRLRETKHAFDAKERQADKLKRQL